MASLNGAVRFQPGTAANAQQTYIADADFSATPPTGTIVRQVQLVIFDADVVKAENYSPGDPATEKHLCIADSGPIMMDLAAFATMTSAEADAAWHDALLAWGNERLTAGPALVKALWGSQFAPPVLLGA